MEQALGEVVQCEPRLAEAVGQLAINALEVESFRIAVLGGGAEVRPPELLVERQRRRAALRPSVDVLRKQPTEKQRTIREMRAQEKRLRGRGIAQREQDVRHVIHLHLAAGRWPMHARAARKGVQHRRDVIRGIAARDRRVFEHPPAQHVEIKRGGDFQRIRRVEDRRRQRIVFEDVVARLGIDEQALERDGVSRGVGEGPDDELKIVRRKPSTTVCVNHRDFVESIARATQKSRGRQEHTPCRPAGPAACQSMPGRAHGPGALEGPTAGAAPRDGPAVRAAGREDDRRRSNEQECE